MFVFHVVCPEEGVVPPKCIGIWKIIEGIKLPSWTFLPLKLTVTQRTEHPFNGLIKLWSAWLKCQHFFETCTVIHCTCTVYLSHWGTLSEVDVLSLHHCHWDKFLCIRCIWQLKVFLILSSMRSSSISQGVLGKTTAVHRPAATTSLGSSELKCYCAWMFVYYCVGERVYCMCVVRGSSNHRLFISCHKLICKRCGFSHPSTPQFILAVPWFPLVVCGVPSQRSNVQWLE